MSKTLIYITAVIGLIVTSGAGYYAVTHWETLRLEMAAASTEQPETKPPAPQPAQRAEHGQFGKRFEPKPPPPNGGRSN
jgi:hypothetical protein